jgi:hypothetical protein
MIGRRGAIIKIFQQWFEKEVAYEKSMGAEGFSLCLFPDVRLFFGAGRFAGPGAAASGAEDDGGKGSQG